MSQLSNQIKFTLSDMFLKRTWQQSSRMPVYKGSYRKSNANFVGLVGEKLAIAWFRKNGLDPSADNEIEHDLRIGNVRIEVKTKDRTVDPLPHYEATVPKYVYDLQQPDYYLFGSLKRELPKCTGWYRSFQFGYLVGFLSRSSFNNLKYSVGKGYKSNGANFFCDAWNCKISDLRPPEELLDILRREV